MFRGAIESLRNGNDRLYTQRYKAREAIRSDIAGNRKNNILSGELLDALEKQNETLNKQAKRMRNFRMISRVYFRAIMRFDFRRAVKKLAFYALS